MCRRKDTHPETSSVKGKQIASDEARFRCVDPGVADARATARLRRLFRSSKIEDMSILTPEDGLRASPHRIQTAEPRLALHFAPRLESMRGIAAMAVALFHSCYMIETRGTDRTLVDGAHLFFNGTAAVSLFFVLSGYVLGQSLQRQEGGFLRVWAIFGIRRLARIYPAFLVSTTAMLLYLLYLFPGSDFPAASVWFKSVYREPLTFARVIRNFLLQDNLINIVTWTLRVELICSLLLPVLHRCNQRLGSPLRFGLFAVLVACSIWRPQGGAASHAYMFYLGMVIPGLFGPWVGWLDNRPNAARGSICMDDCCSG